MPHTLTHLYAGMRAACAAADAADGAAAASIAAFAACCARAWCRVLLQSVSILCAPAAAAAVGGGAVASFVASSMGAAVLWVAEEALPVAVALHEGGGGGGGGEAADAECAGGPAAVAGLRSIVGTLASACADLASLGLAVDAGVALAGACCSSDGLPLPGGGGHTVGSPLEWAAALLPDASVFNALLRLALRLHVVACGNAHGVVAALAAQPAAAPVPMAAAPRRRLWASLGRLLAAASAAAATLGDAPAAAPAAGGVEEGEGEEEAAAPAAAAAPAPPLRAHMCQSLRLAWCAALQECRKGAAPALAGAAAGYTPDFLASALPEALLLGAAGDGGGLSPDSCAAVAALAQRGEPIPAGGLLSSAPAAAALLLACSKGGASAYVSLAQVSARTRARGVLDSAA